MSGRRHTLTTPTAPNQKNSSARPAPKRSSTMKRIFALALLSLGAALAPHTTRAQDGPPKAPVREVTDTYFGQKVVDPYRWMEDAKSPEMAAWMKAQAEYTRAYLDRLPMRQELLARISKLNDAGVQVFGIQRRGTLYFYYRLAPGENDARLYVRDGLNGSERLLVDPEKIS